MKKYYNNKIDTRVPDVLVNKKLPHPDHPKDKKKFVIQKVLTSGVKEYGHYNFMTESAQKERTYHNFFNPY